MKIKATVKSYKTTKKEMWKYILPIDVALGKIEEDEKVIVIKGKATRYIFFKEMDILVVIPMGSEN